MLSQYRTAEHSVRRRQKGLRKQKMHKIRYGEYYGFRMQIWTHTKHESNSICSCFSWAVCHAGFLVAVLKILDHIKSFWSAADFVSQMLRGCRHSNCLDNVGSKEKNQSPVSCFSFIFPQVIPRSKLTLNLRFWAAVDERSPVLRKYGNLNNPMTSG